MVVSYTTTILRVKKKAIPYGKVLLTKLSALPIFRQSGADMAIATSETSLPLTKGGLEGM